MLKLSLRPPDGLESATPVMDSETLGVPNLVMIDDNVGMLFAEGRTS